MASLSFQFESGCAAGGSGGLLTVTSFADAPGAPAGGSYTLVLLDAHGNDWGGPVSQPGDSFPSLADSDYSAQLQAEYPDGSTAKSARHSFSLSCAPTMPSSGTSTPPAGGGSTGGGGTTPTPTTPPPVTVTAPTLPELSPVGVPLWLTLAAAEVAGSAPSLGTVLFDLSGLGSAAGVVLVVDGYRFTSGPLIVPGRFTDAATLLLAMLGQPALAQAYRLSQPAPDIVLLTARTFGVPGTPVATTSNTALVPLTTTAGVAARYSQARAGWQCWVELWAGCGSVFGGPTDKTPATVRQRFVLDYRPDNAYACDLAPALAELVSHALPLADGSCPDRLVSYFVRYGEQYPSAPGQLATVQSSYETAVAWGLDAMEVLPAVQGRYLLTRRPGPWLVAAGDAVPAYWLGKPNADARTLLRVRLPTSRLEYDTTLGHPVATGQVTQATDKLVATGSAAGVPLLTGKLLHIDVSDNVGAARATLAFGATGPALLFVNRQGGCDTVYFGGSADETGKRTAATFTNQAGAQHLSADFQGTQRLYTKKLTYAEWAWLRAELAVSPAAWLLGEAAPTPVLIADVASTDDRLTDTYLLTVDLQPAPVRGLSN